MVFRVGTPSTQAFDPVLIGSWGELAKLIRRHLPGLKAPASLVPDSLGVAIWALGVAVRRWPTDRPGTIVYRRAEAFRAAGASWLTLYGLKSRYDDHLYRGDDEHRHVWELASRAAQTLTREDMPRLRMEFRTDADRE